MKPISRYLRILITFCLIGTAACSEPPPTTNAVRAIELKALDTMISEQKFNGFLVAMASWCPPCREELPLLADIFRKYQGKGINIMAISLDADGPSAVQPLINELQIPFPVYWVGQAAVQHYKIIGIPTLLAYRRGRLIEKIPGSQTRGTIEEKIKSLELSQSEPN